jgi:hypothetical protein
MAETDDISPVPHSAWASISFNNMKSLETQSQDRPLSSQTNVPSSMREITDKTKLVRWNGPPLYSLTWELLGVVISICFLGESLERRFAQLLT